MKVTVTLSKWFGGKKNIGKTLSSSFTCRVQQQVDITDAKPTKVTVTLAKNFGGKTNHWKLKDLSRTLQPCFKTWHDLIWGMHRRSEISPVSSCLVHEEKLSPFDMFHKLKYIEQCTLSSASFNEKMTAGFEGGVQWRSSPKYTFLY